MQALLWFSYADQTIKSVINYELSRTYSKIWTAMKKLISKNKIKLINKIKLQLNKFFIAITYISRNKFFKLQYFQDQMSFSNSKNSISCESSRTVFMSKLLLIRQLFFVKRKLIQIFISAEFSILFYTTRHTFYYTSVSWKQITCSYQFKC